MAAPAAQPARGLIKRALLFKPNVAVTSVPFHLGRTEPAVAALPESNASRTPSRHPGESVFDISSWFQDVEAIAGAPHGAKRIAVTPPHGRSPVAEIVQCGEREYGRAELRVSDVPLFYAGYTSWISSPRHDHSDCARHRSRIEVLAVSRMSPRRAENRADSSGRQ